MVGGGVMDVGSHPHDIADAVPVQVEDTVKTRDGLKEKEKEGFN